MDVHDIIANNLKQIREDKKLSLDQLAKITGVSKSMLGQIERQEVNPTISVIWKIANGLKISFTSLVEYKKNDTIVVKQTDIIPLTEDHGNFINYPIFPYEHDCPFENYRILIHPGGILQAQAHMQGTEEFIVIYQGELIVTVGDNEYRLFKGDAIRFKADIPHTYQNTSEKTTEYNLVIFYHK